jgi:CBS domain containing-hemolysin-like protein
MKKKTNVKWIIKVVLISIVASITFTLVSAEVLGNAGNVIAFLVLALFILIGIIFDLIGLAVASAVPAPFHSMAAHRGYGATEALRLLKNADKVSSFCNDVVGDVTGIISGSMAALIAAALLGGGTTDHLFFRLLIPAVVTGLTVGGKAISKPLAFNHNVAIVLSVGKIIAAFNRVFRLGVSRKK